AIEFLDARSADGKIRKYRVMLVGGAMYPLHLAVSTHWKVHYFTADMLEFPEHRAEEARFLEDMPGALGPRAMRGLEAIRDALGLDYAGVDFALDRDGTVLLFEANATMTVPNPPQGEMWAYRRAPIDRILAAVRRLLTPAPTKR
ncbi:MAG: hypothetical protein JO239_09930, partial [Paraburkholderia sp.]|nr:hypothetical protein [Paraburkholderia sp.]